MTSTTATTLAEEFLAESGFEKDFFGKLLDMRLNESISVTRSASDIGLQFQIRDAYIARFGFAVLTVEMLRKLVPLGPFLEVGAGTGYWSYELLRAGADVIATDLYPGTKNKFSFCAQEAYTDVLRMKAEQAVIRHPDRTLLIVWPTYQENWAAEALARYRGDTVVSVGEGNGGCTADDRFHEMLDRDWIWAERIPMPQFYCMNDVCEVYRRRQKP